MDTHHGGEWWRNIAEAAERVMNPFVTMVLDATGNWLEEWGPTPLHPEEDKS